MELKTETYRQTTKMAANIRTYFRSMLLQLKGRTNSVAPLDLGSPAADQPANTKGVLRESVREDGEPKADQDVNPGELTFEEDTRGGLGRHLGLFSTTFLM